MRDHGTRATHLRYAIWARRQYTASAKMTELLNASQRQLGDAAEQRRLERLSEAMSAFPQSMDPRAVDARISKVTRPSPRLSIAT